MTTDAEALAKADAALRKLRKCIGRIRRGPTSFERMSEVDQRALLVIRDRFEAGEFDGASRGEVWRHIRAAGINYPGNVATLWRFLKRKNPTDNP